MIENERNPSWVPLVTLFLPVDGGFTVSGHSGGPESVNFGLSGRDGGKRQSWGVISYFCSTSSSRRGHHPPGAGQHDDRGEVQERGSLHELHGEPLPGPAGGSGAEIRDQPPRLSPGKWPAPARAISGFWAGPKLKTIREFRSNFNFVAFATSGLSPNLIYSCHCLNST